MPAAREVALTLLTMTFLVSSPAMAQTPAKSTPSKRDAAHEKCNKEAQNVQGTAQNRARVYKACIKAAGQPL